MFTKKDEFHGVKYELQYLTFVTTEKWKHFKWNLFINGEVFEYRTGEGHATSQVNKYGSMNYAKKPEGSFSNPELKLFIHIPKIEHILQSLFSDAQAGQETFEDFCFDFGYSDDSIKAMETYRACQKNYSKLRKALGSKYNELEKIIQDMEL